MSLPCLGTSTLLEACLAKRVPRLIFTSTIDVVVGDDDIRGGNETLPVPDKFLFPGYPATKLRAEQLVLNANGASFSSGESRLRFASLSNCHVGHYYVLKSNCTSIMCKVLGERSQDQMMET